MTKTRKNWKMKNMDNFFFDGNANFNERRPGFRRTTHIHRFYSQTVAEKMCVAGIYIRPKQKIKPNIVQGNRPFYLRHRISFEKLCTVFDKT